MTPVVVEHSLERLGPPWAEKAFRDSGVEGASAESDEAASALPGEQQLWATWADLDRPSAV